MAIELDHFIVPCRNRVASARLLAELLGVPWEQSSHGVFSPVYINDGLTLDFDEGSRLEILSTSIGYEAWQLNSVGSCIVAGNEGRLSEATYSAPQVMIGGPWE